MSDCIRKTLKHQPWSKDLSNAALSLLIDPILATAKVLVLSPRADPGSIIGFIVCQENSNTVHWLHVRKPFRLRHYGTDLLDSAGIKPGPVKCQLMVNALDNGVSLQDLASLRGYKLRFRPWMFLEILAAAGGQA